jgi:hypothetical protein
MINSKLQASGFVLFDCIRGCALLTILTNSVRNMYRTIAHAYHIHESLNRMHSEADMQYMAGIAMLSVRDIRHLHAGLQAQVCIDVKGKAPCPWPLGQHC